MQKRETYQDGNLFYYTKDEKIVGIRPKPKRKLARILMYLNFALVILLFGVYIFYFLPRVESTIYNGYKISTNTTSFKGRVLSSVSLKKVKKTDLKSKIFSVSFEAESKKKVVYNKLKSDLLPQKNNQETSLDFEFKPKSNISKLIVRLKIEFIDNGKIISLIKKIRLK